MGGYPPQGYGDKSKEVWEYLTRVLTNLPDARAALIDAIPDIETETDKIPDVEHETEWSTDPVVDNRTTIVETSLTEHTIAAADFVYPDGATEIRVILLAMITAQAQVAPILAPHHIGIKVQRQISDGGWADLEDFTANPPLGLAAEGVTASWSMPFDISALVESGDKLEFRFTVTSTDAADVNYTTSFLVVLVYRMS